MNFPGHNYLGPGNKKSNNGKPPVDSDDEIAQQHDLQYEQATSPEDIREADRQAIGSFAQDAFENSNWHSGLAAGLLGAKYATESLTGIIYPSQDSFKKSKYLSGFFDEVDPSSLNKIGIKRLRQPPSSSSSPQPGTSGNQNKKQTLDPKEERLKKAQEQKEKWAELRKAREQRLELQRQKQEQWKQQYSHNKSTLDNILDAFNPSSVQGEQQPIAANSSSSNWSQPSNPRLKHYSILHPSHKDKTPIEETNSQTSTNMDTHEQLLADQPTASAKSASARVSRGSHEPGGGGGGGSGMGGVVPIYHGLVQHANESVQHFTKSYHFYMSASLPSYGNVSGQNEFIYFFPGGIHDIPWNYLFCYVSPREAHELRTQYTEVTALHASCGISSLGVRLPFETNSSKAATANANAQYPIALYNDLDKFYYTLTTSENIEKIRMKMVGGDMYTTQQQDGPNERFPNLSAQACSRKFENRLGICLPNPHRKNDDGNIVSAVQSKLSEPQMYQFCELVNGSNHLGPLFEKQYSPKNGLLFSRNTIQTITEPAEGYKPEGITLLNVPHCVAMKHFENTEGTLANGLNLNQFIPAWNMPYESVLLENEHQFSSINPKTPGVMPRFLVGLLPIRNHDETLLNAQWEFILTFRLTVKCSNGFPGYYGKSETWPCPNYIFPNLQYGDYNKSLYPAEGDKRMQFGSKRLLAKEHPRLPVQNKPVLPNGLPTDPSIEGVYPEKENIKNIDHLYDYSRWETKPAAAKSSNKNN